MNGSQQESAGSADAAAQGAETPARRPREPDRAAEAGIWTERMSCRRRALPARPALANGVKGGKWFSLIDKVYAPKTLEVAWAKVSANKGAAGVDGVSIERFAAKAEEYLA